jgi:hypothetical protein
VTPKYFIFSKSAAAAEKGGPTNGISTVEGSGQTTNNKQ